jgi:hypothetical protein
VCASPHYQLGSPKPNVAADDFDGREDKLIETLEETTWRENVAAARLIAGQCVAESTRKKVILRHP